MENTSEMLKGLLEGCVLEIISRGETYGYEITQYLRDLGFRDIVEGTVYAILVRLENNKLVETEKKTSAIGPPRKFYVLTDAGLRARSSFWERWNFVAAKINQLQENLYDRVYT